MGKGSLAQPQLSVSMFFDIFILCLFWQSDDEDLRKMFTTVEKVARILHGLGLITEGERRTLFKNRQLQFLFLRNICCATSPKAEVFVNEHWFPALGAPVLIFCQYPGGRNRHFCHERLLRDYRLFLTLRGVDHARAIEGQYAYLITKDAYGGEIDRQEQALPKSRRAAVICNYRAKVEDETE